MKDSFAVHMAIYKWKAGADINQIEAALDSLKSILSDVKGLRILTWGRNESKYSEGFSHAILIIGDTPDDINLYRKHPLHKPVAELLDSAEDIGVGVDFQNKLKDKK